jgi:hypothetical protein
MLFVFPLIFDNFFAEERLSIHQTGEEKQDEQENSPPFRQQDGSGFSDNSTTKLLVENQ